MRCGVGRAWYHGWVGDLAVRVLEALDRLYEAALDRAAWPAALTSLAGLVRSPGATLELHDAASRTLLFFEGAGLPTEGLADYQQHYHSVNPRIPVLSRARPGQLVVDADCVDRNEVKRSPFYAAFLARYGFGYFAGVPLHNDASRFGLFSVQRPLRAGPFDAAEGRIVQAVAAHVGRALTIDRTLHETRGHAGDLREVLDRLAVGVVLLDGDGRIEHLNREAERLGGQGRGLRISRGRLQGMTAADRSALARCLRSPAAGAAAPAPPAERVLVGDERRRPLEIVAFPMPLPLLERERLGARTRALVVLLIQDPFRAPRPPVDLARRLYRLTAAESRLADDLLRGLSLREHAASRGVSINTARTHLAHLRDKLGVRNQAGVVRMLAALALPFGDRGPGSV